MPFGLDLGAFLGIVGAVIAVGGIVAGVLVGRHYWLRTRQDLRALAKGMSKALGKEVYLDGIPDSEDKKLKRLTAAGLSAMSKSKWNGAIRQLSRALRHAEQTGNGSAQSAILNAVGVCYYTKGQPDEAFAACSKALDLAREFKDKEGEANSLGSIGLVYQVKGDLDTALKYHQDALKIDREIGYQQGAANQLGNIGNLLVRKGECDRAVGYLVPALSAFTQMGIADGPQQCRLGLKDCLAALGRDRFLAACEKAKLSRKDAEALAASLEAQPSQPEH